jgi:hypothetical protein
MTHQPYTIDMTDTPRYFCDAQPLLSGCRCYTCVNHSRSYIAHLLNADEMLGDILLQIHNVHHYTQFFAAIRIAIEESSAVAASASSSSSPAAVTPFNAMYDEFARRYRSSEDAVRTIMAEDLTSEADGGIYYSSGGTARAAAGVGAGHLGAVSGGDDDGVGGGDDAADGKKNNKTKRRQLQSYKDDVADGGGDAADPVEDPNYIPMKGINAPGSGRSANKQHSLHHQRKRKSMMAHHARSLLEEKAEMLSGNPGKRQRIAGASGGLGVSVKQ